MTTKKTSAGRRHGALKTPTTQSVVQKVQRRTSAKNGGEQSDWVRRLHSTRDKRAESAAAAPAPKRMPSAPKVAEGVGKDNASKDNTANQRNPNHEQFYKSRGLPARPADWEMAQMPRVSRPGAR